MKICIDEQKIVVVNDDGSKIEIPENTEVTTETCAGGSVKIKIADMVPLDYSIKSQVKARYAPEAHSRYCVCPRCIHGGAK